MSRKQPKGAKKVGERVYVADESTSVFLPPKPTPPSMREVRDGLFGSELIPEPNPMNRAKPTPLERIQFRGGAVPSDAPRPGQSRYRLARKGPRFRIEHFRSSWWGLRQHWTPVAVVSLRAQIPAWEWVTESNDEAEVRRTLEVIRHLEAEQLPVDADPTWQPVEDP